MVVEYVLQIGTELWLTQSSTVKWLLGGTDSTFQAIFILHLYGQCGRREQGRKWFERFHLFRQYYAVQVKMVRYYCFKIVLGALNEVLCVL